MGVFDGAFKEFLAVVYKFKIDINLNIIIIFKAN